MILQFVVDCSLDSRSFALVKNVRFNDVITESEMLQMNIGYCEA